MNATDNVEPEARDLGWIKASLQSAIALECATLPVYLSAMFSLEVQNYTAYNLIRSVAMEEMVHMAIGCNVLAALGGTPQIKSLDLAFPRRGLPGGTEPDIEMRLAQLSKRQLETFLRLEAPLLLLADAVKGEHYLSISTFYTAIRQAVKDNAEAVRAAVKKGGTSNQVGDNIGFSTVTYQKDRDPVAQINEALSEIMDQGEGAASGDLFAGAGSEDEASHYCKLASIYFGAHYQDPSPAVPLRRETLSRFFEGRPLPWPVVINTLAVPADGYARILAVDPAGAEVEKQLAAFDDAFSGILVNLDAAWNGPAATLWPTLGKAVDGMTNLRVLSCFNINRYQVPPVAIDRLAELYPEEHASLAALTDLTKPVFYGPRFVNKNLPARIECLPCISIAQFKGQ